MQVYIQLQVRAIGYVHTPVRRAARKITAPSVYLLRLVRCTVTSRGYYAAGSNTHSTALAR